MGKLETSTRATFQNIASHAVTRVTNRELRWLAHIQCHGPQPSTALIDLTADTHRCKDTALRALQRLRAGGLLSLPHQQRRIERAEFHPYIYDTTPLALAHLQNHDQFEPALLPTGHWWHAYGVGALTAAIDRHGRRNTVSYIPAHAILDRSKVGLAIPTALGPMIPDQLFALDYGGAYRAFLLEYDRGTEPLTGKAARESLERKLSRYAAAIKTDRHRQHYGLKCPVALLFTFTAKVRAMHFQQLLVAKFPALVSSVLHTVLDPNDPLLLRAETHLATPWQRGLGEPFHLFAR